MKDKCAKSMTEFVNLINSDTFNRLMVIKRASMDILNINKLGSPKGSGYG